MPAARPRVSKFGAYYPKTYKNFLALAERSIPLSLTPFEGALDVNLQFVMRKARTSKLSIPVGDIDNYAKGILDVLTKLGYWHDDKQVVRLDATKRFLREDEREFEAPHVYVRIEGYAL